MTTSRTTRSLALAAPLVLALSGTLVAGAAAIPPDQDRRIAAVADAAVAPAATTADATPAAAQVAASTQVTLPLAPGGRVASPDGQTTLVMQQDGNLVLYKGGRAVFSTGTFRPNSQLRTDEVGNLEVVDSNDAWVWSTDVAVSASRAVVNDSGTLQLLGATGNVLWSSAGVGDDNYAPELVSALASGESYSTIQGGRLVMQPDGNLVSYSNSGRVLFATNTFVPGSRLAVQDDGNAVIYGPDGRWLWQTSTGRRALVVFLYDGHLLAVNQNADVLFDSSEDAGSRNPTPVGSLTAGQSVRSLSTRYRLDMQADGNLVVYDLRTHRARWSSRTGGHPGARFIVQSDGNLVIATGNRVHWNSRTARNPNARLVLQDDGNLVLYSSTNRVLWSAWR